MKTKKQIAEQLYQINANVSLAIAMKAIFGESALTALNHQLGEIIKELRR